MPKGFTLIEVLVVMVIVSIVTTVALLSLGRNQTKDMQALVAGLTQSLSLAQEQAMLAPAKLGLSVNAQGWQFWVYQGQPHAQWQPEASEGLGSRALPDHWVMRLRVLNPLQGKTQDGEPPIIITSDGDMTPFVITLSERDQRPKVQVQGRSDGSVFTEVLS